MSTSNSKEVILKAVNDLPDDATFEDAIERIYLLSKIKKGIQQADSGLTISHEDVEKKFSKWLT